MSKFVNFMRDYVFARSVIPIGIIVIAIGIYASTIYGDRKDYPRCEATVTDSELLSGSYDSEDNTDSRVYRNYIKYTVDGQEYKKGYEIKQQTILVGLTFLSICALLAC